MSSYSFDECSKKQQSFITIAKNNAISSDMNLKVGVVITFDGKVISEGYNDFRNRFDKNNYISYHAEMNAIYKMKKGGKNSGKNGIYQRVRNYNTCTKFNNTCIYIVRVDRRGNFKKAQPCHYCLEWIYSVGIKKICYSDDDEQFRFIKSTYLIDEPHYYTKCQKLEQEEFS